MDTTPLPPPSLPSEQVQGAIRILETLLARLGIEGTITSNIAGTTEDPLLILAIDTTDSGHVIGEHGTHLHALQHIASLCVRHAYPTPACRLLLDVNGYRHQREQRLQDMARTAAARVTEEQQPLTCAPMNSAERRIIHLTLADDARVVTESAGAGDRRHVIIRPKDTDTQDASSS